MPPSDSGKFTINGGGNDGEWEGGLKTEEIC